jgi:hypothetical protein
MASNTHRPAKARTDTSVSLPSLPQRVLSRTDVRTLQKHMVAHGICALR